MKVVLFCGGLGSRMREYSAEIPKPLVPVKGRPIICHIMDYYARFGHTDFILCLGHHGDAIRRFFAGDGCPEAKAHWTVTCVDTGLDATIAGRLAAVRGLLGSEAMFLANYGDGLSDFEMPILIERVAASNAVAGFISVVPNHSLHVVEATGEGTVLAVHNAAETGLVVNGGFFVLRPAIFDEIRPGDELVEEPFRRLIARGALVTVEHRGFWRCIDTLKDLVTLEHWLDEEDARGVQHVTLPGRPIALAHSVG